MTAPDLLFSEVADTYARFRPGYPAALYDLLLERTKGRSVAVDLGAGTGAMLPGLLASFERVVAVEPDAAMAAHIPPAPNLTVVQASAEEASLPAAGVDLFTVGTAFHWFDGPLVLSRLAEAAAPGAWLAVCTYYRPDPGPAAKPVIEGELKARWNRHKSDRLARHDYAERVIAAHADWTAPEEVSVPNVFETHAADLAGFYASTSYASAYLRTVDDPDAYLRGLAARLATAAGSEILTVSLTVETLLSQPVRGPA